MQKPFSAHRLLTLAALLAALPAAAAPNNITDLGTLKNDNSGASQANAVNSDGSQVFDRRSTTMVKTAPPFGRAATGPTKPTSAHLKPTIREVRR